MADIRAAMLAALNQAERGKNAGKARSPDDNNPWRAETARENRRTQRPYRDPVGEQAIGNIKREKKS